MALNEPSVESALHDLELLKGTSSRLHKHIFTELILRLRNVRTFLLCGRKLRRDNKDGGTGSLLVQRLRNLRKFVTCARKLGTDVHMGSDGKSDEDENLGSLPVRIEDEACRFARKIHPYCLSLENGVPFVVVDMTGDFQDEIECFDKEIDEWYVTFSEYLLRSSSNSPRTDEVLEITESVLESLGDFLCFCSDQKIFLFEPMKELGESIKFLRNFTRFATLPHVQHPQLEPLLTHVEAVAVNAAHISHMCQFAMVDEEWWKELLYKIAGLLQKIKPMEPQVYETYTQVLTSSKLSRELHAQAMEVDDNPVMIMKEFISSLACNLWEMLQLDTCLVVSLRDQLQELYEGLRFLRMVLEQQPNKFDQQDINLTGALIREAGRIIFSLYQKDVKIDLALFDLLRRIKLIRAEVEEKVPEISTFNFPKTNAQGFVDFLLEILEEFTVSQVDSNAHSYVKTIQSEVVFIRSFLGEIEELRCEQVELQSLWNRALEVAYRIEFLIDHLVRGDIPDSFKMSFDSIIQDIRIFKNDALKIFDGKTKDVKVKKVSRKSSRVPSQKCPPITNEIVGFDDEATSILDRLKRGSKQLKVVAIVGMAGIGKTTLATKVYSDPSVLYHFDVCAWCSVSQALNKKKVLLELLNCIIPDRYFDMTELDLAEKLRRRLKGCRYLIFLDDVWDIEVWNSLEGLLPDDSNGSRIMLTSRLHDVAPQSKLDQKPHFLRQLIDDESWELLQRKLFNEEGCPSALYELGTQIAKSCKRLPLTIIIVAGLLAAVEQECWKEVLESLSSGIILSSAEQCMNTMELSYKHLPDYLKPCFLYFGAFPEDKEVSVKRLIHLWIAEGFILETEIRSLEDVAIEYLMDLVGRSLVIVGKQRSIGGVKTCRIHDLLHDFCMVKAKEENFFQFLRGYDELSAFNEPCYLRRLCIHSEPEHFKDSRLFCPRVRTLLFFSQSKKREGLQFNIYFVIHIFKLLRVLDLEQIHLGSVFPSEMELLVQLRFLAVQGEMEVIPSSIGNLLNLETFIVNSQRTYVSLPDTLWNLRKLRHLYARKLTWFVLPTNNLENLSNFDQLNSCSGAVFSWPILEGQMRKFPNMGNLKCRLVGDEGGNCNRIMICDILSQLE